jgi:hypothetical protein
MPGERQVTVDYRWFHCPITLAHDDPARRAYERSMREKAIERWREQYGRRVDVTSVRHEWRWTDHTVAMVAAAPVHVRAQRTAVFRPNSGEMPTWARGLVLAFAVLVADG